MSTGSRRTPRFLALLWTTVLLAPAAWSVSLVAMFWLTQPVCQGATRGWIFGVGAFCAALAIFGSVLGWQARRRQGEAEDDHFAALLLDLGRWSSLLFALVIVLSIVPIALLTPCPV